MKINEEEAKRIDCDERGNPQMTTRTIKYYCSKEGLFETPHLNEKLYLHYKGFKKIEGLEEYPNLVTLWLGNNCIQRIENLETLSNLICLYLNNNVISRIENLEKLHNLQILHLQHNQIERVDNLGELESLHTLNLSENFLSTPESIECLNECKKLSHLDLSKNELENSEEILKTLSTFSRVTHLHLKNTPFSQKLKGYRKKVISVSKEILFLDDRAVTNVEKRLACAWVQGGLLMENEERAKIAKENEQKVEKDNKIMSERIERQQQRDQTLRILKIERDNLFLEKNETNIKELEELNRRIEILQDGPKGFQAMITETSIRVLNVEPEEHEEIVNKYFWSEKKQIEENVKNMEKAEKFVQGEIDEDEVQKQIEEKVRNALNLTSKESNKFEESWNEEYNNILEALLFKEKFNFEKVLPEFNRIISSINRHLLIPSIKFSEGEIQEAWTQIEMEKRKIKKMELTDILL